ncbi:hypothetical protein GBAR_LOCUS25929, partial [Geodia barretti]
MNPSFSPVTGSSRTSKLGFFRNPLFNGTFSLYLANRVRVFSLQPDLSGAWFR